MGSLVLDKINYAEAKKLEICELVGVTGNPTWNQLKQAIEEQLGVPAVLDEANRLAMSKGLNISFSSDSNFRPIANNSVDTIDTICYVGDKTFSINQTGYFEFVNYSWQIKFWSNKAPNKNYGAYGVWLDGDGVLHYANTSVYNPETDDWDEVSDIGGYSINWNACFPLCFWNDYDGNTHYDYGSNRHYVYNKTTKTWSVKTWTGLTNFNGDGVWNDGTTIYYSSGSNQYYLDSSTGEWVAKTWSSASAISSFNGRLVFYLPEYSVKTSVSQRQIPFVFDSGSYYKFDISLGYWVNYKFRGAITNAQTNELKFWHWKKENTVTMFKSTNTTSATTWMPINNTWEDIEITKAATLDYLMNH